MSSERDATRPSVLGERRPTAHLQLNATANALPLPSFLPRKTAAHGRPHQHLSRRRAHALRVLHLPRRAYGRGVPRKVRADATCPLPASNPHHSLAHSEARPSFRLWAELPLEIVPVAPPARRRVSDALCVSVCLVCAPPPVLNVCLMVRFSFPAVGTPLRAPSTLSASSCPFR